MDLCGFVKYYLVWFVASLSDFGAIRVERFDCYDLNFVLTVIVLRYKPDNASSTFI